MFITRGCTALKRASYIRLLNFDRALNLNRLHTAIETRLSVCFGGGEWRTVRRLWGTEAHDETGFVTANILSILRRCEVQTDALRACTDAAKAHLPLYQQGHKTYHWRLRNGYSLPSGTLWGRWKFFALSPDADNCALQQLALQQSEHTDILCRDLEFYRIDGKNFVLPHCQQALEKLGASGTFLTWFPEPERLYSHKPETIDIGVQSNVLWYLAETDRLDTGGATETIEFIRRVVETELILTEPFLVSHYYPYPAVLLYLISRAAVWGDIAEMKSLRESVLKLERQVEAATQIDELCLLSVGVMWEDESLIKKYQPALNESESGESNKPPGAFYAASVALPFALRFPKWKALEKFAANPVSHYTFESEAMNLALRLWCLNRLGHKLERKESAESESHAKPGRKSSGELSPIENR